MPGHGNRATAAAKPAFAAGHHARHRGHQRIGAQPADVYYADMDGTWTDYTVTTNNTGPIHTPNMPNDGQWDQSVIPSAAELQVGRVDMHSMTGFELSETELILVYAEMTSEERMLSDIEKASYISSKGENHPYNQISTLNPYRLRLFGTDDCSYSYFFNEENSFHGAYILANPCWSLMENRFVFTN